MVISNPSPWAVPSGSLLIAYVVLLTFVVGNSSKASQITKPFCCSDYTEEGAPTVYTGSEPHLHVLFHGGDVYLISDLQLVMVAGVHQHLVIESPVPHLTSGILCSLEREGRIIWQSQEITV